MATSSLDILVLCLDGTPVEILTRALLSCYKSSEKLIIHTTAGLTASVGITKFDFVVLLVDGSKADCLESLRNSVASLDVGYLCRKCCVVSLTANSSRTLENYNQIDEVLNAFHLPSKIPVWSCNFKEDEAVKVLAAQILNSVCLESYHMGVLVGEISETTA